MSQNILLIFFFFLNFLIDMQLIYNISLGVQHRESILLQIILHFMLFQCNGCISLCWTIYPVLLYVMHSGLSALIPYPYLAPPPFLLPTGNLQFILYICKSVSVWLYIFVCFIFQQRVGVLQGGYKGISETQRKG